MSDERSIVCPTCKYVLFPPDEPKARYCPLCGTDVVPDVVEIVRKALVAQEYGSTVGVPSWKTLAEAAVLALEPEFQRRERAAKREVLESLASNVDPSDMIHEWFEETKDYYPNISLQYWLRMMAETVDAATADTADRTTEGE